MIIPIKVIARAKKEMIKQEGGILKIYVNAPRDAGRANAAVIKMLAKNFNCPKSAIRIVKGEKSREKLIEIN